MVYYLSQQPLCVDISPTVMIHMSNNEGIKREVFPITIIPNDLLVKFLLPIGCKFGLCWSKDLSSQERTASTKGHSVSSIRLEVEITMWPFWAICASESTSNEGVIVLAHVINSDCQGEIGLLLQNEGKRLSGMQEILMVPVGIPMYCNEKLKTYLNK